MNLNTACKPRQSVFDRSRKDVVLNIDNLPKIPQSPVSSGRGCKEYRRSPALKSK